MWISISANQIIGKIFLVWCTTLNKSGERHPFSGISRLSGLVGHTTEKLKSKKNKKNKKVNTIC